MFFSNVEHLFAIRLNSTYVGQGSALRSWNIIHSTQLRLYSTKEWIKACYPVSQRESGVSDLPVSPADSTLHPRVAASSWHGLASCTLVQEDYQHRYLLLPIEDWAVKSLPERYYYSAGRLYVGSRRSPTSIPTSSNQGLGGKILARAIPNALTAGITKSYTAGT